MCSPRPIPRTPDRDSFQNLLRINRGEKRVKLPGVAGDLIVKERSVTSMM